MEEYLTLLVYACCPVSNRFLESQRWENSWGVIWCNFWCSPWETGDPERAFQGHSLAPLAGARTRTPDQSLEVLLSSGSLSSFTVYREKKNKHTQSPHSLPQTYMSRTSASCEPDVCPPQRGCQGFPGLQWADEGEDAACGMRGVPAPSGTGRAVQCIQCHLQWGRPVTGEDQAGHEGLGKNEVRVLSSHPCSTFYYLWVGFSGPQSSSV